MSKTWAVILLLFFFALTFSQKKHIVLNRTNKIVNGNYSGLKYPVPLDSIRILAVMVEFQEDADELTTGDGTFQKGTSSTQIDPPPHDSLYFQNKLRFVENYFRKVSNGVLTVTGDLITKSISLSKIMSAYTPTINLDDKSKLVELVKESWQKADSLYPQIDFAKYDAFVVFHAGAGRDINLVDILAYDPTPFDIPSIYLDSASIANVLGSTPGIPVRGNTLFIKNSIILPETESRIIPTAYGNQLLQYSINGLFAASIGNYLGLPDLFDTYTGRSGIGMFGLMDGAGFFSFSGLFPPEPSAWEKIYLGWVKPIVINGSSSILQVPAVSLMNSVQDTIYKIPINGSEYFLVENRSRILEGSGVDIDIADGNGNITRQHFNQDVSDFYYYDISAIHGSVVDVSNFDWAFWGQINDPDKFDGGGILVWHIDENIIQQGLKTNSVNTNINHRGIDLEEADGSQDIGREYEFLTPGSGTENGTPYDFWFQENGSPIYKNVFSKISLPNSLSYSGASSLITIKDFSIRSPRMTMTVEIGDNAYIQKDSIFQRKLPPAGVFPTSALNQLYIPTINGLFAFQNNGISLTRNTSGLIPVEKNIGEVAVRSSADSIIIAGVHSDTLEIVELTYPQPDGVFDSIHVYKNTINKIFTSSPCFLADTILVGADSGYVYKFTLRGELISSRSFGSGSIYSFTQLSSPMEYYCVSGSRIFSESNYAELPVTSNDWILASTVSSGGDYIVAGEKNGNKIICLNRFLSQKIFEVTTPGNLLQNIAIADLNGDGEKEIILQYSNSLYVLNRAGISLDGFPVQMLVNKKFSGTPLIADFNGDARFEIITFTDDGELWIYNSQGILMPGYPVQAASPGDIFPMVYRSGSNTIGLAINSSNDSLNAFKNLTQVTSASIAWGQHLADERHSNSQLLQSFFIPRIPKFLPSAQVYNWPNPVYGSSTQIRYYTAEDAEVTVSIFDISGVIITELKGKGIKGLDNEITWNVSNIQSGVYIARIEARGIAISDVAFIKIAVVK